MIRDGRQRVGIARRVDGGLLLADAVEAVDFGDVAEIVGRVAEDAEAQVGDPGFLLVECPGEAEARGEAGEVGGVGHEGVAQASINGEVRRELDGVLQEEGHSPLDERDEGIPAGELVGGGLASGEVNMARRYCSMPLMVVVPPVGWLLASRTGALPPPKT